MFVYLGSLTEFVILIIHFGEDFQQENGRVLGYCIFIFSFAVVVTGVSLAAPFLILASMLSLESIWSSAFLAMDTFLVVTID